MKYMIDTNICIYALNRKSEALKVHFGSMPPTDIVLSVITLAELRYGASYSAHPKKNHERLDMFLSPFEVLPMGPDAALCYGEILAALRKKGTLIGPMDALIASQALAFNLVLVTNNLKEFKRVPGLICEDWSQA